MTITRIEAEQMALTGYQVEDTTVTAEFASGGKLIRLPDTGNTGTATHTFSLDSGTYDITVAYHDESDGKSPFSLNRRQTGQSWQEVDKWSANQNFNNTRASAQNRVLRTISGVSLNKGDEVQIIGQLNVGEVARVDYIEYKPVSSTSPTDTTAPTATGTANDITLTSSSQDYYSFTVTYSDNQGIKVSSLDSQDIRVTGPNNFSQLATFFSVDTDSDGTPRTATYRISAPGGSWDTNEAGTYTVAVQSSQVNDTSNNAVAAVNLDTFKVTVNPPADTTAPTATGTANDITLTSGSQDHYSFTVTYSDNQGIKVSSLDSQDIRVTGPNNFSQLATFFSVDTDSDGTPRTATYRISAPGGSWDTNEAGTYTVAVQSSQVNDTSNNAVAAVNLDTFKINVQSASSSATETVRIEAEAMTAGGAYRSESGTFASGGQFIGLSSVFGNTGTATTKFTGASGKYKVIVGYFDESDGSAEISLDIGGTNIDKWVANQSLGDTRASAKNFVKRTVTENLTLAKDTEIKLSGTIHTGENARIDYVEFVPVTDSTTPPSTGKTANYSNASKGIHANLEQKVGYIPDSNQTLEIMPLGDSITQGKIDNNQAEADREGYRRMLWENLNSLGVPIDFVGSQSHGTSGFDRDHQGHPGWKINEIKDGRWNSSTSSMSGGVNTWINSQTKPDVVLLMIGTNDADSSGSTMANQLSSLIDKITANSNFTGDLLVSTIAPIHADSSYSSRMPNVEDYNSRIPGVVSSKPASENVRFVNMWEGTNRLLKSDITAPPADNGLHPTKGGYQKMASYWFNSILEATGTKEDLNDHSNIQGSAYNDVIVGNSSNNTLEGGAGNDKITGRSGADKFVYNNSSHGEDTLTDFNPSQGDLFEISASGFGGGLVAGTALSTTASNTGVFVNSSSFDYLGSMAHFFYNSSTGVLSFDRDGNQSQAPVTLATLSTKPTLGVGQFVIV